MISTFFPSCWLKSAKTDHKSLQKSQLAAKLLKKQREIKEKIFSIFRNIVVNMRNYCQKSYMPILSKSLIYIRQNPLVRGHMIVAQGALSRQAELKMCQNSYNACAGS